MASKKPKADPRKGKAGRKTKLTPERQKVLCGIIRRGLPEVTAYTLARITHQTFYRWLREGEADEKASKAEEEAGRIAKTTPKSEFRAAITRAREEGHAGLGDKWREIVTKGTTKTSKTWKDIVIKETTTSPDGSVVTTEKVVRVLDRETTEMTGDGDWRGIEAYLERRWPESWAKPKLRIEGTLSHKDVAARHREIGAKLRERLTGKEYGAEVLAIFVEVLGEELEDAEESSA